jgi:hypothetical protein
MYRFASIAAVLLMLLSFGETAVSAQTTFNACRVPGVGAIYMVGVAGAPSACLDASHVAFSWTEGGAPADGSITTVKLADGAVTSAKIADGTITVADVVPSSVQARVTGTCAVGNYVTAIAANGAVTCGAGAAILGLEHVLNQQTVAASAVNQFVVIDCPAGKRLLSGGLNYSAAIQIMAQHPEPGAGTLTQPAQFRFRVNNLTGSAVLVNVHAICANAI